MTWLDNIFMPDFNISSLYFDTDLLFWNYSSNNYYNILPLVQNADTCTYFPTCATSNLFNFSGARQQTPCIKAQNTEPQLFSFNSNKTKTDTFTYTQPTLTGSINAQMAAKAKSYVNVVNTSAEGNRLFSPKGYQNTSWYKKYGRWGWGCDFAVYCAKDTLGSKYPKDMITSSPAGLVDAADKNHHAYISVPDTNKASWLTRNVKQGDIIYMKGSGDSGKHIAVVDSIDSNGKIHAISGNSKGKVRAVEYDINKSGIYGFISLNKLAA